jgi:hypothetical protein
MWEDERGVEAITAFYDNVISPGKVLSLPAFWEFDDLMEDIF